MTFHLLPHQPTRANFAAHPRFTLTASQAIELAKLPEPSRKYALADLVNAYDFLNRPIVGVPNSLRPIGMERWQQAWALDREAHIARGVAEYERVMAVAPVRVTGTDIRARARTAYIAKADLAERRMQGVGA